MIHQELSPTSTLSIKINLKNVTLIINIININYNGYAHRIFLVIIRNSFPHTFSIKIHLLSQKILNKSIPHHNITVEISNYNNRSH